MSDMWKPVDPVEPTPEEPTPVEPTPVEPTPAEAPQQPQPEMPQPPQQPPMNGWSSDGSYRYVPPRAPQRPPRNEPYRSVTPPPSSFGNNYGSFTPPQPPRRKKNNGWVVALAIIAAVAVIGVIVFLGLAYMSENGSEGKPDDRPDPTSSSDTSGVPEVNEDAPSLELTKWDDDDGGLTTKEVIRRNKDSTVVLTEYAMSNSTYFGESGLTEAGAATGIVWTEDGYIITNCHCVVDENTGLPFDRVDVTTYDGKTYEDAEIIGADQSTDLAVIKIDAKGLTPAQFGDSSELEEGDRIVVLGNAAGLSWTATQGIVSALARDVYEDTGYAIKCLQVDAAINFGVSGGPLLNNQGLVVGINSAKIAASGYESLGFSIPINEAKTILDSLMKYGYVRGRVALGVTGKTISSGVYSGYMIASIDDNSSLKKTDVQVGDLIVKVDNETVNGYSTLRSALAKHEVGDTVTLTLLRSDRRKGGVTEFKVKAKLKEQAYTSYRK